MLPDIIHGKTVAQWCLDFPALTDLLGYIPTFFRNQVRPAAEAFAACPVKPAVIADAAARLERFRPYIAAQFPETRAAGGLIESPLRPLAHLQQRLTKTGWDIPGQLLLKCDHQLPIAGSVKARGGVHEVLTHAENLALEHHLLQSGDDYALLTRQEAHSLFAGYQIAVGSTGNLGLSIGIMGASFGFQVSVHMSADAKAWKKKLLRDHGVRVIEHQGDYGQAVLAGRQQTEADPRCHFIDDENSLSLFSGYAVAARRLGNQLDSMGIVVDNHHPLFVYLPCGVGGAPGGVTFGLKQLYGDNVRCFFAEPTHSPCMLLGLGTGLHDGISVQDFGLDNHTAADGLAVGRASGLVGRAIGSMIEGVFSVDDQRLYELLALAADTEQIFMEPSALAGLACLAHPATAEVLAGYDRTLMDQATHIAWSTGGAMVPKEEMERYYARGAARGHGTMKPR